MQSIGRRAVFANRTYRACRRFTGRDREKPGPSIRDAHNIAVRLINHFLDGTIKVLTTMAMIKPTPGKPFVNNAEFAMGTVSAVIEINGEVNGSMALTFTDPCIRAIVHGLPEVEGDEIDEYVEDIVGELTNMICGTARSTLRDEGFSLNADLPSIIKGKQHRIEHWCNGPRLAIPFETLHGQFMVEVVMDEIVQLA